MAIDKLKLKFFTGAWLTDVKHYFTKINEIIDQVNNINENIIVKPLIYKGLITQIGTNDPTVVVLENTIGNIIWTRFNTGEYIGTLAGAYTLNKTYFVVSQNLADNGIDLITEWIPKSIDDVYIATYSSNTVADDLLTSAPILIEVYP